MTWAEIIKIGYDKFLKNYDNLEYLVRCKDCKHREVYECNNIMLCDTKCDVIALTENERRQMPKQYIDRNALIKDVENLHDCYNGFSDTYDKACIIGVIEEQPISDVVEQSTYDQVRRERDTAITQLAEIGKELGEKMDDVVKRKKGNWIHLSRCDMCPVCRYSTGKYEGGYKFCPNCGSDLREGEENAETIR